MGSNVAEKSSDSINDILASIKVIIEENNEDNTTKVKKNNQASATAQYALNSYQSQSDYVLNNHPNFKNHFDREHKGAEILTVDDAIDNLARQIGIPETKNVREESNLDNVLNNLNSLRDTSDLAYKKSKTENISLNNSHAESLIVQSAMEEVNSRLRAVISRWFQDNLPALIKQIIHEEMTKVLKNIKL